MTITHLVLILVNDFKGFFKIETKDFKTYNRFSYENFNMEKSIILGCANGLQAKNIKIAIDTLLLNDIFNGLSFLAYKMESFHKAEDLVNLYTKHLKGVAQTNNNELRHLEFNKYDTVYDSLNFFKLFNEIIRQVDEVIQMGADFEKVNKAGVKSIIHNRNLEILNNLQLNWIYNEGHNIIIDYSGIIEWKALGVYTTHRRLVEIKYFK